MTAQIESQGPSSRNEKKKKNNRTTFFMEEKIVCFRSRIVPWMQSNSAKQPHRRFIIKYQKCPIGQTNFIFR